MNKRTENTDLTIDPKQYDIELVLHSTLIQMYTNIPRSHGVTNETYYSEDIDEDERREARISINEHTSELFLAVMTVVSKTNPEEVYALNFKYVGDSGRNKIWSVMDSSSEIVDIIPASLLSFCVAKLLDIEPVSTIQAEA